YCHMKHAGQLDVVNVVAHASDQARILFAKHPAMTHRLFIIICEADGRFCGDTHTGLLESSTSAVAGVSCAAAHWMLLTMVSYPVHRQIWPEIASRMVSALGSGSRSRSALAVIIIPGVQKPHCRPWHSMNPCCTGSSSFSRSRSPPVRIACPPAQAA